MQYILNPLLNNYNNKKMSYQSIYGDIISRIKTIYLSFEDNANQKAKEQLIKRGGKTEKIEEEFFRGLTEMEKFMAETLGEMRKEEKGAKNQYLENIRLVEDCLKDIRTILRKKTLSFKVNEEIKHIIDDTKVSLDGIRADLKNIKETKFLCCGTDGMKKFKTPMSFFKVVSGKWRMLTLFEAKEGIQTFLSPKFSEADFQFIGEILRREWPQQKVKEVVKVQEVIKEVPVQVNTGKPSVLHRANECLYGINKEENITEGLQAYHQQADRGNPQACCFLGKVYQEGILLPQDLRKAKEYYKLAIKGKQNYASYRYAMSLIKGLFSKDDSNKADIQEGFKILSEVAADNQNPSPQALTELGEIYQFGNFEEDRQKLFTIKKDISKANMFYSKAEKLKLPRAANNLGVLYLNIKLNEQKGKSEMGSHLENDKVILGYLEKAKEAGFSQAYYNLGIIYSKGLLGQRDSELALKMFYEGSIKGDYKCKIKFAYQLMNQTSIMKEEYEDHYHLAIQWLQSVVRKLTRFQEMRQLEQQITKQERAQALFYLGLFHQHGFGVEKSPKKAINYFIQASGLEYAAAKNKIGDCYFSGYGLKQDRQLAVGCYLEAAEQGSSDAMVNLGTVYLNGIPNLVDKSFKKAYEYFLSATELDNTDAMIHLSYMYKNGLAVEQNDEVARELLEQAAQAKNSTALYMLREQGVQFNEGILFEHLDNEFFSAPKKLNIKETVPLLQTQYKSRI